MKFYIVIGRDPETNKITYYKNVYTKSRSAEIIRSIDNLTNQGLEVKVLEAAIPRRDGNWINKK